MHVDVAICVSLQGRVVHIAAEDQIRILNELRVNCLAKEAKGNATSAFCK